MINFRKYLWLPVFASLAWLPLSAFASAGPMERALTTPVIPSYVPKVANNLAARRCVRRYRCHYRHVRKCVRYYGGGYGNYRGWVCKKYRHSGRFGTRGYARVSTYSRHMVYRLRSRGYYCHRTGSRYSYGRGYYGHKRCAYWKTYRVRNCHYYCAGSRYYRH